MDSSPNGSRGGAHGGRCDRSEYGICMDRVFPCVWCVGAASSCPGWTAAVAGMLKPPAVSASLTPRYREIGGFASLGGTCQFMSRFVTGTARCPHLSFCRSPPCKRRGVMILLSGWRRVRWTRGRVHRSEMVRGYRNGGRRSQIPRGIRNRLAVAGTIVLHRGCYVLCLDQRRLGWNSGGEWMVDRRNEHTYQDLSKAAQGGLTFEELATSRTVLTVRSKTNEESRHLKHLRSRALENIRSTSSSASKNPSISVGTV